MFLQKGYAWVYGCAILSCLAQPSSKPSSKQASKPTSLTLTLTLQRSRFHPRQLDFRHICMLGCPIISACSACSTASSSSRRSVLASSPAFCQVCCLLLIVRLVCEGGMGRELLRLDADVTWLEGCSCSSPFPLFGWIGRPEEPPPFDR